MTTDTTAVPTLSPGWTHLEASSPRTPALHQLTLAALADLDGRAYWIDSRSTASTHALLEGAVHPRRLDPLQVARAFTAYQHHSLVQAAADRATDGDLVVVPCLDALYADDDVPEPQARALLADTLETLGGLADAGVVVAVTAGDQSVANRADQTLVARSTDLGIAYEGESFETTLYRGPGFWQTTIPYWVELLGVCDPDAVAHTTVADPIQTAIG